MTEREYYGVVHELNTLGLKAAGHCGCIANYYKYRLRTASTVFLVRVSKTTGTIKLSINNATVLIKPFTHVKDIIQRIQEET